MNYRIKYNVTLNTSTGTTELIEREILVRNRENELWAKLALEDYLGTKHGAAFVKFYIYSCKPESDNPLEDFLSGFKKFGI